MDICNNPSCMTCLSIECLWRNVQDWREIQADIEEAQRRFREFNSIKELIEDLHQDD